MNAETMVAADRARHGAPRIIDKEVARIQSYSLLILVDVIALGGAFGVANLIYLGDFSSEHGMTMLMVILPIYLIFAVIGRAYDAEVLESRRTSLGRSIRAFALAASAILFIAYFLKAGAEFSRAVFTIGFFSALVLLPLLRLSVRRPILRLLGGSPHMTVVIRDQVPYVGTPHEVVLAAEDLGFQPQSGDPFQYHLLAQTVAHADRVIVACRKEHFDIWSSTLKGMAVNGEILVDDGDLGIIGLGHHDDRRTMIVAAGPLHLPDRILKRVMDIVVSSVGLVVLSPLLVGTAIAIRRESRGPVLFRQNRIGQDNKIFRMYKFRSMYHDMCDADAETLTSRDGDARVTKVGAFIRRTSIDELPQLVNVLLGDMSIVGPRPHAMSARAADLLYWDIDPRYRHRHSIKPGVTGLAQVRGYRGATDCREDLMNRLNADLEYAREWSIWLDFWIILRTVRVLQHNNAF